MLSLVLVFLFAQSALSGPAVIITQSNVVPAPVIKDNRELINSNSTAGFLERLDNGELSYYEHLLVRDVINMASLPDLPSKAIAAFQTISIVGQRANGIPGDTCPAANLIDTLVGDTGRGYLQDAMADFMNRMFYNIDVIVGLVNNPDGVRYSSGLRGNCLGGGRTYQIDKAWDRITDECNANEYQKEILYRQYCASKRLYNAFDVRCNNIAAATTVATMPEVQQIAVRSFIPVGNFMRVVASNKPVNPAPAAEALKEVLWRVFSSIRYP